MIKLVHAIALVGAMIGTSVHAGTSTVDTNKAKNIDIARCAGVTQGMMDNGAIDTSSEPILMYYSQMMEAVLFAYKVTPQYVMDSYVQGYTTGLDYKLGKYGKMYFSCVMSTPNHMF